MQYTCVNGVESSPQRMQCGIPQGSNLGPLLCIHKRFVIVLSNCNTYLYADDTCLYYASPNPKSLIKIFKLRPVKY